MGALEEYKAKQKPKAKQEWRRPELEDFAPFWQVLSFDQSLTNTGYVQLWIRNGFVEVRAKGTLRTATELNSFDGSFAQAEQLEDHMKVFNPPRWPDATVVERPSVGGFRTDSSLLAAYVVTKHCNLWWHPHTWASIQHSRVVLAGPGKGNDKKAGHEALEHYIPDSITRKWNEHTRDAAVNALAYLYDRKKELDVQQ